MIKINNGIVDIYGSVYDISYDCLVLLKSIIRNEHFYNKLLKVEIKKECKDDDDAKAHVKFISLLKELKKEVWCQNEDRDDD